VSEAQADDIRPFLAKQARTDLPEGPEGGRYDDEQQVQISRDASSASIDSPEAVRVMMSGGGIRPASDGGDDPDDGTNI
jgi:hypothetical protein